MIGAGQAGLSAAHGLRWAGLEPDAGFVVLDRVNADPRIHLVGYGPSASTIGANRAGRAAARELVALLGRPAAA